MLGLPSVISSKFSPLGLNAEGLFSPNAGLLKPGHMQIWLYEENQVSCAEGLYRFEHFPKILKI